jgi:adrenodoxin-NADP+ reductase
MKLPNAWFTPADKGLIPPDLKELDRAPRRLMDVLLKGSVNSSDGATAKNWHLDFCMSPVEFRPAGSPSSSPTGQGAPRVTRTIFRRTHLNDPFDPMAAASLTDERLTLPSSTVFRSIGYRSLALPGFVELGISHDDQSGVINNDGTGRVLRDVRTTGAAMIREPFPGLYCTGWVKTGPTGVIVSTMADAFSTADAIVEDWTAKKAFLETTSARATPDGWNGLSRHLNSPKVVHWDDWARIDNAERERGRARGKEREKFTSIKEMLEAASSWR